MILFGITNEYCHGCGHESTQVPLCDDCLVRWSGMIVWPDVDQPEQEAA